MLPKRYLWLLVLLPVPVAYMAWVYWPRTLTAPERELVGKWSSGPVSGVETALTLAPDGTCRLAWTSTPAVAPQSGTWRVNGGMLIIDTREYSDPVATAFRTVGRRTHGHVWTLVVKDSRTVHQPGSTVQIRKVSD